MKYEYDVLSKTGGFVDTIYAESKEEALFVASEYGEIDENLYAIQRNAHICDHVKDDNEIGPYSFDAVSFSDSEHFGIKTYTSTGKTFIIGKTKEGEDILRFIDCYGKEYDLIPKEDTKRTLVSVYIRDHKNLKTYNDKYLLQSCKCESEKSIKLQFEKAVFDWKVENNISTMLTWKDIEKIPDDWLNLYGIIRYTDSKQEHTGTIAIQVDINETIDLRSII